MAAARRPLRGEHEQGRFMIQNGYERDCMRMGYNTENCAPAIDVT